MRCPCDMETLLIAKEAGKVQVFSQEVLWLARLPHRFRGLL